MSRRGRSIVVLVGLLLGCEGRWQTIEFVDEGDLCFEQRGTSVAVVVTPPECLSSGCSRDLDGSCDVTVDGTTILLSSEVTWEQDEGKFANCKADCGSPSIECDLGMLAAGSYTVVHGEDELALVVPADGSCPL